MINLKLFKHFRSRLFLKILFIFSAGILISIVFSITARRLIFHPTKFPDMFKSMIHHSSYIINDIGIPPDFKRAAEISGKLGIRISITGNGSKWKSGKETDFPSGIKIPVYPLNPQYRVGFGNKGFSVSFSKGGYEYILLMPPKREAINKVIGLHLLIVLSSIILIIIGIYFIMRWLLKPVKLLDEGVRRIRDGDMDYRIKSRRTDELGLLITSFNEMRAEIKNMIKGREHLLVDVSHELRSPITRVKVALEFLDENETKKNISDDIAEFESKISELLETERLNSKYGDIRKEETEISGLTSEVIKNYDSIKPGIKVLSFPKNIKLNIDKERIRIVFRNILDNALKYSDPSGYPIEISVKEKIDEITIAIRDFGTGIPAKDLTFVFEPFYRVDKSRSKETGGYGLGLSLCKKIMEAHKGAINITSKPEKGTIVYLRFRK